MNTHVIKNLAKQLRSAADGAVSPSNSDLQNFRMHDGVAYSLTNEASITFNEAVNKLLKQNDFTQKFSAKYIEKQLMVLFARQLSDNSFELEEELKKLENQLNEFSQNNVVFLKVEGIALSACFVLGNVRFVPGDDYLIDNINQKVASIVKTLKNNEKSKTSFQQLIGQESESELRGGCVGIVEVNAEPIRAFEVAKEEVRRAIDLLRFSSKAIHPLTEDIRIGLKGDHQKSVRQGFILSDSGLKVLRVTPSAQLGHLK